MTTQRAPRPAWTEEPISAFDAELRSYDPDLFLVFYQVRKRWQIWRRNPKRQYDKPSVFSMEIATPRGGFREPCSCDIDSLAKHEMRTQGFTKGEYMRRFNATAEETQEKFDERSASERKYLVNQHMEAWFKDKRTFGYGKHAPRETDMIPARPKQ